MAFRHITGGPSLPRQQHWCRDGGRDIKWPISASDCKTVKQTLSKDIADGMGYSSNVSSTAAIRKTSKSGVVVVRRRK